jgi:deoxyribonuclease V
MAKLTLGIVSPCKADYNKIMRTEHLHDWDVTPQQALEIQRRLASAVSLNNDILVPRLIAGLDVSVNRQNEATAAAVVLTYPELKIEETAKIKGKTEFPYVPGLLSFREIPLLLEVCEKLNSNPELVLVDGQGIAHPRRIGLASHLGILLNTPTIGCAKSLLLGKYQEPDREAGNYTYITDNAGTTIGAALRTKSNVKPLFISIGHKIDLSSAIHWVLQCCQGYRLPDPTRLAHLASKGVSG